MLEKCPNTEFFLVRVLFTYQLICQQYLHNQNKKQSIRSKCILFLPPDNIRKPYDCYENKRVTS